MFSESTFVTSPTISGYDDIAVDELEDSILNVEPDVDKPVDHVIFVIHGIGQQTEQYGQFYRHIEDLQEVTRQVLQTKVPDHDVRIELIPIEWHKHIHEEVDPTLRKITLKSIPTIRLIENEYLADVLFYFSKDRGQKIVDNVTNLFNTSYEHFIKNHPNFNGKIIILGYSLGGIITWDILCNQSDVSTPEEQIQRNKLDISFSKLAFKPDYLFGLGSPIGAILTFRGQDPKFYHPDLDIQFENIFHPFDPLGYRFEPLLHDAFTEQPAVVVERSIPIGPSFSFPSFPLSSSIFSFFSWKQDKPENTIYDNTSDVADDQESQIPSGFMSSLLQYFSKGTSEKSNKETNNHVPENWEAREQFVSVPEEFDRSLESVDDLILGQRPNISRSKTYNPRANPTGDQEEVPIKRAPLRKSITENNPINIHHQVEVLGIDGLRMEIPKTLDETKETLKQNVSDHNPKKKTQEGGDNIWSDLNKELHMPGPAITEPGETKTEVAQGVTVPESDDNPVTEDINIAQKSLPGGRRIDFVLQPDSVISMIANEYLIGLRAHFSYWTNKDVIWHMLRRIEDLDDKKVSELNSPSSSSSASINFNKK